MADLGEVKRELSEGAEVGGFVQRLAERVGGAARAAAVFGEPTEREGVTVIPVARAAWGFGGGGGTNEGEEGAGGGGGGFVRPIGFIELRAGEARFKPIRDPRNLAVSGAAAIALAALAIGRAARG